MNLVLDTNIILNIARAKNYSGAMQFINPNNGVVYCSIVSEAEIKSLAIRNNWGVKRNKLFFGLLEQINIVDVNQSLVNTYVEIDAYSQRLNPAFSTYPFDTPRNMGKNDIWIAALAALLNLTLVTTDADFDHLNGVFFEVRKIDVNDFKSFF